MGGSWVEEEAGGIYGIKGLAIVATQLGEYALQSRLSGGLQKPFAVVWVGGGAGGGGEGAIWSSLQPRFQG